MKQISKTIRTFALKKKNLSSLLSGVVKYNSVTTKVDYFTKKYMLFDELNLSQPILEALKEINYTTPTPIQEQSIPELLAGRDLFGCAQTGTGKTAAFALPIIEHLGKQTEFKGKRPIRCLILAPTRELAIQINDNFRTYEKYTKIRSAVIFGGVKQAKQVNQLSAGVDVLIATPGRLLDLMNQGFINLSHISHFVLDEADRMLDMGFIHDIKRILPKLPKVKQNIFFSATISPTIMQLAGTILNDPANVRVTPVSSTAEIVQQSVYFVEKEEKRAFLKEVIKKEKIEHAIVFTRTKHGANRVAKELNKVGIVAEAIHGDKSQPQREKALNGFKDRSVNILVATDIASRGIDIEDLSHVINFEIPEVAEAYVHRIGRTGRAGKDGIAISFCSNDEKTYLKGIEKLINQTIPKKVL
jgi:ATP-dependent RNA helicase RhlE